MITELETNNKNAYNKSDENQIIQSENISVEGGCLPSLLIYNENLAYQTVNSNNESATASSINFNQSNNNSIMTVKKAKNETKKRTHSTINGESSTPSSSINESSKKINKSETKSLKEEPISPKNQQQQQQQQQLMLKPLDQSSQLNNNYLNSPDQFELNQSIKYPKTVNNSRFVFTSKLINRASQMCETNDQKDTSTLTSNKDPTLASSSISSPSSPSSSSSSSSNSTDSSSLCHS
jgi:hypothetical protein